MSKNIAIIGSGFLGLTIALRLADAGNKVTIFESASEIGGLASAWQIGDITWDKHYHVTLFSDSHTRKLIGELGLADDFTWVETKTGFYTGGKLYSMSNSLEFLKFPPLGLISKFRLGATIFYASKVKDWKALEKVPVEEWLTKLSGKKTFEKIWQPLLKAKLGEAYKETSAAFIWATIQRMYAARNSGFKREMFGYVNGGYARILKRFGEVLLQKGVEIKLNSRIEKIERENGKVDISSANTKAYKAEIAVGAIPRMAEVFVRPLAKTIEEAEFDEAILTCPSSIAASICPQLSAAEKRSLERIKYQGIICASVLMRRGLSPYYITNITDESPFTGIIEMSALVDKAEFGGNSLIYLPKYVAPDDPLFEKSDEGIKSNFLGALAKMYPDFNPADVLDFKVSRVRQVFPLPALGYSERLPDMKTSIEGIYIINSAQITNGTLNVNETIQLAERFIEKFMERSGNRQI